MKVRFIGDVHGAFKAYEKIINGCDVSVQVGDFGIGFPGSTDPPERNGHYFLRGNHDNPGVCLSRTDCLPHGMVDSLGIFVIPGADSIDKDMRTPGYDWWYNEQLSWEEVSETMDWYRECKPDIVVSHDCPQLVCTKLFGISATSYTRRVLDEVFKIHKPAIWIFGHHHVSKNVVIEGTSFNCLNQLEWLDLEID